MKRTISIILMLVMILGMLPTISVSAATSGIYTYTISNDEARIIDCSRSASGAITIPSTLGGYPVTSIGNYAFDYCKNLTNITISFGVTSIDKCAFEHCESLTNITIPFGVTSIGEGAFDYCTNLISITIPDSVTGIAFKAFSNCSNLEDVYYMGSEEDWNSIAIGGNNNYLKNATIHYNYGESETASTTESTVYTYSVLKGGMTIVDCDNSVLGDITIPDTFHGYPVTRIGDWAFGYCNNLTNATIPDSVTFIGDLAFYNCDSLTSVTIPDSVTFIGDTAFGDCDSLTNITIPDSVTSISYQAFYFCTNLTSITIPDSVTSIGMLAFSCCGRLANITIPDSVTRIGYRAFCDCESLTSITIPASVTSIEEGAFLYCENLKDVYYAGNEEDWNKIAISGYNENLFNATIHYNYGAPEPTPAPIPADISYTFDGVGKVIVNTNVTIDRVYWGFTGDTTDKPVVNTYADLKAIQVKAGKTGKNVVNGQEYNLERKGWYTFVAQYTDPATGINTEVIDSFYVPVAAPKPTMTQLIDFPKQVTLNIPETERVEKVYYAMTGTDVRPEIRTFADYQAAILNDTGRSTEKMTNGTTFEMKLDGYYTFVIRYYSSRLETVNTIFYTYCSRDNTIPVFTQNYENIAEVTMTSEDQLNKLYWAYMGTEKPEIKSYADFNNGIVSDKKSTTSFKDVNTYTMTKEGWYSFVASYQSSLLNKTANKYASFENKPMPAIPSLRTDGALVTVVTEETINRVDWGYAGNKKPAITTSAEYSAAKADGKIINAAYDKSVVSGDTFEMTEPGWYVFMINYNNTFLGKAKVKFVYKYYAG